MHTADSHLQDKVILVTGASRGIGEAIARECSRRGARVALSSRKQEGLDPVAASIREAGGTALAVACHMGKSEQIDALFERVEAELGPVDGLVNNAAANPYFGLMIDCPDAAFAKTFEVNVKGYFDAAVRFVRRRRAKGLEGGAIVNVASVVGMRAAPMQGVYGMTKAAILSMTQTLAFELGSSGVRVNAVAPGLVETRFAGALISNPTLLQHFVGRSPLGRHAQPGEIAGAVAFLLSDAASFITGQTLAIDGGFTIA